MKNSDVRVCAIEHGVRMWELADRLGISPETLSRKLRRELEQAEKERMIQIIQAIAVRRWGCAQLLLGRRMEVYGGFSYKIIREEIYRKE